MPAAIKVPEVTEGRGPEDSLGGASSGGLHQGRLFAVKIQLNSFEHYRSFKKRNSRLISISVKRNGKLTFEENFR